MDGKLVPVDSEVRFPKQIDEPKDQKGNNEGLVFSRKITQQSVHYNENTNEKNFRSPCTDLTKESKLIRKLPTFHLHKNLEGSFSKQSSRKRMSIASTLSDDDFA